MSSDPTSQFEDAGLKQAVRQVWPATGASQMTRARIAEMLRNNTLEESGNVAPVKPRGVRWMTYAAAAVLAIAAAGTIGYQVYEAAEQREYIEANLDRFRSMVKIHAEPPPRSNAEVPDMARLAQQLGRPVGSLSASDGAAGSARIAMLGGAPIAQVRFGTDQKISVLSVPASALVDAHDGFTYDIDLDGYHLVGEVRGDNVFCIIGDPNTSAETIRGFVRRLTVVFPQAI